VGGVRPLRLALNPSQANIHICLAAHFPGLVQALQYKVAWFN
jgi:hypothetical protein